MKYNVYANSRWYDVCTSIIKIYKNGSWHTVVANSKAFNGSSWLTVTCEAPITATLKANTNRTGQWVNYDVSYYYQGVFKTVQVTNSDITINLDKNSEFTVIWSDTGISMVVDGVATYDGFYSFYPANSFSVNPIIFVNK